MIKKGVDSMQIIFLFIYIFFSYFSLQICEEALEVLPYLSREPIFIVSDYDSVERPVTFLRILIATLVGFITIPICILILIRIVIFVIKAKINS